LEQDRAADRADRHHREDRGPVRVAPGHVEDEPDHAPGHEEVAEGEVEGLRGAEGDVVAERDQRVDHPLGDPADQELQGLHGALLGPRAPRDEGGARSPGPRAPSGLLLGHFLAALRTTVPSFTTPIFRWSAVTASWLVALKGLL